MSPLTGPMLFVLRVALGAIFIVAGVAKLRDPTAFATEITNFHLLPSLAPHLAIVLPPLEVLAGAALVVAPRSWRAGAALVITGLLAVFVVAVVSVVVRGIDTSCGCFGKGGGPVTWLTALERLGLLVVSAGVFAAEVRRSRRPLA